MAEALSPADRASLAAEQGPVHMSVGGLLVFGAGPGLSYDAVVERVRARLHLLPRYRQRLRSAAPGLANPEWADDADFDLGRHVRVVTVPAPGDGERLGELVGHELARRLERDRPLWELTIVEGVAGGRTALLAKMHHALVDGVAAVDIGTVLLDPSPEPLDVPEAEPWQPKAFDRNEHLLRLSRGPLERARRLPWDRTLRALADPRRAPEELRRATEDLLRATDVMVELARTRPQAPPTPLNVGIGPNRRYATRRVDLAALKAVAKPRGATVNDAVLAIVAGMLRRYLLAAGEPLEPSPVALVPVSVRQPGDGAGNRISTVLIELPVGEADPEACLDAVRGRTRALKDSAAVRAGALLVGATGWAPPLMSNALARAMGGVRAFNLVVSNVPGPQQPFYLNGERLLEVYPAVPLNPASQGLSVGVLSYDGGVHAGLLADRDLHPPLPAAAQAFADAAAELLAPAPD
jgi:diacylglycerol O-acyltransferase